MTPDPDSELAEIRAILRETNAAISQNSTHIADLTGKMGELVVNLNLGREAAIAQVERTVNVAVTKTTQRLVWFLVGAVVLASLGSRGLELLAKLFGVG